MSVKFEQFVRQELKRLGFRFKETRKDFVMPCIRGHDNRTWSLGVRKRDGVCHCFGCGESWSWNRFAEQIDAAQLDPNNTDVVFEDPFALLQEELKEIALQSQGTIEPDILDEWYGTWRDFSEDFLKSIPTYLWWDTYDAKYGGQCHRAYWRVTINGVLKGYVSRRLDNEKETKYRNAAGMSSLSVLFPYDFCPRAKCIVLVEGPVDALRLLYHGISALSVLGTNNWKEESSALLLGKGCMYPIVCGDGDKAGKKFNETVYADLEPHFQVSYFPLPEGEDPGSMSLDYIEQLKTIVDSYNGLD